MTNKIDNISVVIIAKNAQNTIQSTLDSLIDFEEVIIYLNNSTDKTDLIVKKFSNVKVIDGDFLGFGETKNKASTYAKNNWILSLDADEILSKEFVVTLQNIKLDKKSVYSILRLNYYKDIQIKYCWGDDIIIRLYNREKTRFTPNKVHENIISDNFIIKQIDGIVKHYPYSTITDFIIKLDRYSTIFAQENKGIKQSSPLKAILNSQFSFFKTYFLKRGFLDGYSGLIIAFSHMATNFYKYIRLYELNQELK